MNEKEWKAFFEAFRVELLREQNMVIKTCFSTSDRAQLVAEKQFIGREDPKTLFNTRIEVPVVLSK